MAIAAKKLQMELRATENFAEFILIVSGHMVHGVSKGFFKKKNLGPYKRNANINQLPISVPHHSIKHSQPY